MQIIADTIQITDPRVAKALNEMDRLPIQDMAKRCDKAGADTIDVKPGTLMRDAEKKMGLFLGIVFSSICQLLRFSRRL